MPKKSNKGPKGKVNDWLEQDGLVLITGWSRNGLTQEEISNKMNIHKSTLCRWKNEYPQIAKALKMGREVSDLAVENALFSKAMRGDIAAIIFYLKNRLPSTWRERPAEANIEEARLLLEAKKTQLEMMKLQIEIAQISKNAMFSQDDKLNLDLLDYEELQTLTGLLNKARLKGGNNEHS